MPYSLSEEEIDDIMDSYDDHGTYAGVSDELGYDDETVKKYVDQRKQAKSESESEPETESEGTPEGYTAEPPSGSNPNDDPLRNPDFQNMSEGEFIEWFFDHSGHGVRTNFAKNLAHHCSIRREIPDRATMAKRLMQQKSGISNDADVEMISGNYWAAAERWMEATGYRPPQQDQGRGPVGGDWVSGDQQGGRQPSGNWVSGDQQGGQRQQQQSGHRQRQGRPPQGQNGQQPRGQQQNQGGDPEVRKLREEIKELKEAQIAQQRQQQNQQDQGNEVQSLKQQFQQMVELQQTLDDMQGNGDEPNPEVEQVKHQLSQLQDEIAEAQAQGGGGGQQVGGDSEFGVMLQLASQDNMDAETLGVMADAMGVTDPEVKKEEFKYKTEKEKMKNRKELINEVADSFGDVSGEVLGGLFSALQGGGGDDDGGGGQDQQQGQTQQRQQQNQAQAQGTGTQPAGSPDMRDGDIQVVGDGNDQSDGSGRDGMSPARRRMTETMGDGGTSPDPETAPQSETKFRSAGETVEDPNQGQVEDAAEPETNFRGPGGGADRDQTEDAADPETTFRGPGGGQEQVVSSEEVPEEGDLDIPGSEGEPDPGDDQELDGDRCQWIKDDGNQCQNSPMEGDTLCYPHRKKADSGAD